MAKLKSRTATKEELQAYFDAWRAVMADRELTRADIVLLFLLKDSNYETIFKKQSRLALESSYSRWTINQSIKHLQAQNYITVVKPKDLRKPLDIRLKDSLLDPTKEWIHLLGAANKSCEVEPTSLVGSSTHYNNVNRDNENIDNVSSAKADIQPHVSINKEDEINGAPTLSHPITTSTELSHPSQDNVALLFERIKKENELEDNIVLDGRLAKMLKEILGKYTPVQIDQVIQEGAAKYKNDKLTWDFPYKSISNFQGSLRSSHPGLADIDEIIAKKDAARELEIEKVKLDLGVRNPEAFEYLQKNKEKMDKYLEEPEKRPKFEEVFNDFVKREGYTPIL